MIVSVFLLTLAAASAQSPQASPGTAMDQSLERQRAAIRKQAASASAGASTADSWFTTQWSIAPIGELRSGARPVAFSKSEIPCDPLDEAQATTLIRDAASRENLKEDLLRAVIDQESGFRPCAVSSRGAQGLMQLMPATAAELGVTDPFDPRQNVNAGARLLNQLLSKYKGDVKLALSAYNAGSGTVDRAGGIPNLQETRKYLASILQKLIY